MNKIPVDYSASSDAFLRMFTPALYRHDFRGRRAAVDTGDRDVTHLVVFNSTSDRVAEQEAEHSPSNIRNRVREAFQEARRPGWDGYGASAVDAETLSWALRFASAISPLGDPDDIAAEPDGEISFDWRSGPGRVFSVSVSRDGTLSYAGIFGERRMHGTDTMQDGPPSRITDALNRLHSNTTS